MTTYSQAREAGLSHHYAQRVASGLMTLDYALGDEDYSWCDEIIDAPNEPIYIGPVFTNQEPQNG